MFSTKESLRYGWDKLKANFWKFIAVTACMLAVGLISELFSNMFENNTSALAGIVFFIGIIAAVVLSLVIKIGSTKFFLSVHDGEVPSIKFIFSAFGVFWKYIWVSILQGLIMLGGFILLIVPGIIWSIKYSFAPTIVIDTGISARAALRESGNITQGAKLKLFGFYIVIGLINILGYIAFGIGILVTLPLTTLAYIYVYRILSQKKAGLNIRPEPTPTGPTPSDLSPHTTV